MKAGRATILVGVGIIFVIVLTVILWVIPRVAADTSPIASPEGAVASCWAFAIANVFFSLAMLGAIFLTRSGASTALLVAAGFGMLLCFGRHSYALPFKKWSLLYVQRVPYTQHGLYCL